MQEWTVPFGSQINDRVRNKNFRYDTIMTSPHIEHNSMSAPPATAATRQSTWHLAQSKHRAGRPSTLGLWMGRPTS